MSTANPAGRGQAASAQPAFEAIADPVRRHILELLGEGDSTAGSLVELIKVAFGISQPATSQHLKVLREAGLVAVRAEGRQRIYALDRAGLAPVGGWLETLGGEFDQPLDALATEVARGRRDRRRTGSKAAQRKRTA